MSPRFILVSAEHTIATGDACIDLAKKALEDYSGNSKNRRGPSLINGSQFANKMDKMAFI